ncbi:DUF6443 domain-containing protein [Mucilaginibacter sp. SMC90]|uniref:DUF6443 domain-containing protein n=1 Tax=Mucilaginibacter sp. SMC90 TaxID=2929803 RepID=UPI001FB3C217|nr:DUF6443 domain-containing protein [Mucilaginibacter sp. SMC90]UOE51297.1 DUF6443 domain-containing protein [Mucilaginibacter sp. SMC90]
MKSFIKNLQIKNAAWLSVLTLCAVQTQAQQLSLPANNIPTGATITLTPSDSVYPGLTNMTNASGKYNYIRTVTPDVPLQSLPGGGIYDRVTTDYFDGLGRPLQTVGQRSHADGNDIVVPHVYDALGRETYQYQPFAAPTGILANPGKMKLSVSTQLHGFYNQDSVDEQPYTQTIYESSPLSRVTEQRSPGKSWVGSGRGEIIGYGSNSANEVRLWNITAANGAIPTSSGYYNAGTLYTTRTTDEDGKYSTEYKDKFGRLILKKSYVLDDHGGDGGFAMTYYVYDDLGNLRFVMPPLATQQVDIMGGVYSVSTDVSNNLCYTYFYDERNRLVEKKIAGKDVEYYVYDKRDRLVMSQDGLLRTSYKWNFIIYDSQDRPLMTGYYGFDANEPRTTVQGYINDAQTYATNNLFYYLKNYNQFNQYPTIPIQYCSIYTYNYYDDYSNQPGFSFDANQFSGITIPTNGTVVSSNYSTFTRGLPTGTKIRVPIPDSPSVDKWLSSVNYYDDKGRLIQTQSDNLSGGREISSNIYYFQGELYKNILRHQNLNAHTIPGASDGPHPTFTLQNTFQRNLGVDGGNDRVWKHTQKIDNGLDYELAYYDYDHLGRAVTKQFTAGYLLQEYNMRGFLKQLNFRNPNGTTTDTIFQEQLYYDIGFGNKFYNGNIAGITWRLHNGTRRSYGYSYDNLNRLTHAESRQWDGSAWGKATDFTASNITYDFNGNILTMNQMAPVAGNNIPMDILSYKYSPNSNKLINVADAGTVNASLPDFKDGSTNVNATEYQYDNNGHLTEDDNKYITSITYNFLNKPEKVTVGGTTPGIITYTYDALGNRLHKKVYNSQTAQTENWDYIGNFVYKDNTLQYVLNDEGRARPIAADSVPGSSTGTPTKFVYDYFVKDHLGNVRSTVTANPMSYAYLARHEISTANVEQLIFDNIPNVRDLKPGSIDPNDGMAARLNASDPSTRVGTAILLKTFPGDKFKISADAFYDGEYENQGNVNGDEIVQSLFSALTGGATYAGVPMSELPDNIKTINTLFSNPNLAETIQQLSEVNDNPEAPKAHLNYLWFDERFQLDPNLSGTIQVPVNNNGTGGWVTLSPHNNSNNVVLCTTCNGNVNPGYILVYIDNQSIGKDVWFDNVAITEYTSEVTEEDHYYPYGLCMNLIPSSNVPNGVQQPKKYQGIDLEKHFGLELCETPNRGLDPQLGRFNSIDPKAEETIFLSPYSSMDDNPASGVDPLGLKTGWFETNLAMGLNQTVDAVATVARTVPIPGNYTSYYRSLGRTNFTPQEQAEDFQNGLNTIMILAAPIQMVASEALPVATELKEESSVVNESTAAFNELKSGFGTFVKSGENAATKTEAYPNGSFSVSNWEGYPSGGPKPKGPFRLIEGTEYDNARKLANKTNKGIRAANPDALKGLQIHEVKPIKFDGSPVDMANKIFLTPKEHAQYTNFWNKIMRQAKSN